jgi:DNA transposition AAA+ family ATPase
MANTAALFKEDEITITSFDPIRDMLRRHLDETGKSQSEVAKSIGLSSAALSGFIRGTYAGDMNLVSDKVINYLNREDKRQAAPQEPTFVETSIAHEAETAAEFTHTHRVIGLVYGDAGVGKTLALQEYAEKHPDVIFLRARVDLKSARAIVSELMDKLGKQDFGSQRIEVTTVIQALKDSGRMIIIDEAQRLSYSAIETLRDIHDEAKVGLLLAGNKDIYDRMRGRKGALFAQLFSRVGIRRYLQCKDILKTDTQMIFEQAAKLDSKCIDFLYSVARRPNEGGLRQAKDYFLLGLTIARGSNKSLDLDSLLRAQGMLMGR